MTFKGRYYSHDLLCLILGDLQGALLLTRSIMLDIRWPSRGATTLMLWFSQLESEKTRMMHEFPYQRHMSHLNISRASMKKVGIGVAWTSNDIFLKISRGGGHIFESYHRVEGMAAANTLAGLIYHVWFTLCRIHTFTCYVLVSRAPFCVLMD